MKIVKIWPPLVIGAAFFAAFKFFGAPAQAELKVMSNGIAPVTAYDPSSAVFAPAYFLLENIFSPLLEYSSGDELVSGAAERFEWAGSEARFTMRSGFMTADGRAIDAADAEQSLKRLFILGGREPDLLRALLCGGAPLKKLSDPCPGLEVREGGRVLAMKFSERKPFLFHLLTNISYAVIPRGSIEPATLKIKDYRNTSGPYFVSRDAGGGSIELQANPHHYRYSEDIPQKVRIIPLLENLKNEEALGRLLSGKIDYMPIFLVRNADDKARFVSANSGYNAHFSQPIRMVYAVFTDRGLKTLTAEERFFIAKKLRGLYKARRERCEAPDQIFKMEGALSRPQLQAIRGRLEAPAERVIKKKLTAPGLFSYFWGDAEDIKKWLPNAAESVPPGPGAPARPAEPDFRLVGGDIGFQDDVGLVSYYLDMDFFRMTAPEKKDWFEKYAAFRDKKDRMKMLQTLHYRTLAAAHVLPVALLPYASVARKPWAFEAPGMVAGDQLWRLKRN